MLAKDPNAWKLIPAEGVYAVLTFLLTLNRLRIRALSRARFFNLSSAAWWSDFLATMAWVVFLVVMVMTALVNSHGGIVLIDPLRWPHVKKDDVDFVSKLVLPIVVLDTFMLYCVRLSILCNYLEITPPAFVRLRRVIWSGLCIAGTASAVILCLQSLDCGPDTNFGAKPGDYFCLRVWWPRAVLIHLNYITNIYVFVTFFFIIRKLNIPTWPQRFMVSVVFILGGLEISLSLSILISKSWYVENGMILWNWWFSLHEMMLAIVIASLPTLRVAITRIITFRPKSRGRTQGFFKSLRRGELSTREVAAGTVAASPPDRCYKVSTGVQTAALDPPPPAHMV